jgi:hypothetical protein
VVVEVEVHLNEVKTVDQVVVLPITQTQLQVVKQLNHLNQVTQAHMDLEMMVVHLLKEHLIDQVVEVAQVAQVNQDQVLVVVQVKLILLQMVQLQ